MKKKEQRMKKIGQYRRVSNVLYCYLSNEYRYHKDSHNFLKNFFDNSTSFINNINITVRKNSYKFCYPVQSSTLCRRILVFLLNITV